MKYEIPIQIARARRRLNVKAVHLLSFPDHEREQKSISTFSQLSNWIYEYKQKINLPYVGVPPAANCRRPFAIVNHFIKPDHGISLLSSGEYGCYLAHRDVVLNEFDDKGLLILECDAGLCENLHIEDFVVALKKAICICEIYGIELFTFGKHIGTTLFEEDDYIITNAITDSHCYYIPARMKQKMQHIYNTQNWDMSDVFYNWLFLRVGAFNNVVSKQIMGYSLINHTESLYDCRGEDKLNSSSIYRGDPLIINRSGS